MMTVSKELNLKDFEAWSGGKDTLNRLIELNKVEEVENLINECFNNEIITETKLNDFLWFETYYIAEYLGMDDLYE